MKTRSKLLALLLTLCMVLPITAVTAFAEETRPIDWVYVQATQLSYNVGESPKDTASTTGYACEVTNELWGELDGNGKLVAISRFTSLLAGTPIKEDFRFEEGKTYQYIVVVEPKEGVYEDILSAFAEDCTFLINGRAYEAEKMPGSRVILGPTMTPTKPGETPSVEVEAQLSYNPGDEPKATANIKKIIGNSDAKIAREVWVELDENGKWVAFKEIAHDRDLIGLASYFWTPFELQGADPNEVRIKQFEEGKTYKYFIELNTSLLLTEESTLNVILNDTPYVCHRAPGSRCNIMLEGPTMTPTKSSDNTISSVEVTGAKLSYNVGEAPAASASVTTDVNYEIISECWESTEHDDNFNPLAVWRSDGNYSEYPSTTGRITKFEEGRRYNYSVILRPKSGWAFATPPAIILNGKSMSCATSPDELEIFGPSFTAGVEQITSVEVTGATLSYNVGDEPKATAKVTNIVGGSGAKVSILREVWVEVDENGKWVSYKELFHNKEYSSTPSISYFWTPFELQGADPNEVRIKQFEEGKTYQYFIELYTDDADFDFDCTFTLNGTSYPIGYFMSQSRSLLLKDGPKMTPTKPSEPSKPNQDTVNEIQSTGDTVGSVQFADGIDKDYTLDIKQVEVKKELADKNVKFIADISVMNGNSVVEIKNNKMTIKLALPEDLKGYNKYEVVYIQGDEIKETIPATVEDGYIIFETTHLSQYGIIATNTASGDANPGGNNSQGGNANPGGNNNQGGNTNPGGTTPGGNTNQGGNGTGEPPVVQTGDNSGLALWITLFLLGGGAFIIMMVVSRKNKYNR